MDVYLTESKSLTAPQSAPTPDSISESFPRLKVFPNENSLPIDRELTFYRSAKVLLLLYGLGVP